MYEDFETNENQINKDHISEVTETGSQTSEDPEIKTSETLDQSGETLSIETSESQDLIKETTESENSTKRRKKHPFVAGILIGITAILLIELFILNPFGGGINFFSLMLKSKAIEALVDENYLYDADKYIMQENMYLGMVYGLTDDDYAAYYTEDSFEEQRRLTEGSYVGIGVNITSDSEQRGILVVSVNEEGPAFEAGLEAGDIITAVEGESLSGVSTSDAVDMITGEEGTIVNLTILRDEETLDLSVERRTVVTVSVHYSVLTEAETGPRKVKGSDLGYISINAFNLETIKEFNEALDSLLGESDVAGLIIDLRNNGGGELTTCLEMTDRILEDKVTPQQESSDEEEKNMTDTDPEKNTLLLQIESKDQIDQVYRASDGQSVDLPIVVLVNEKSASASEVFAGTLRDYGYKIIGKKTFGKGIVQTTYTLYDDTAVKFTTHQYRLASGELIHGRGIEPDIEVEFEPYDDYVTADTVNYADGAAQPNMMEDKQVLAAVAQLDQQIYDAYQLQ